MHKKHNFVSALGLGALGAAALLLNGCGGSSFQKNTFGNYPNTLPAAYGIEPVGANPNLQNTTVFQETSGLASPDSRTPYLTAATDFAVVKASDGATLAANVDPNGTGKVPLGFSAGGAYLASATPAPAAVQTGTSVVFRAALGNGISNNTAATITATGNALSSPDPQWTLGTLPLTFNNVSAGPLANATYVTGTNETPAPFTLPFTTSGIHTVVVTVADDAGRQTATTFAIPVVTSSNVALFLQHIDTGTVDKNKQEVFQPFAAGDTVTVDGGPGIGTYPPMGYNASTGKPSAPTTADAQGTVVLFTTPGTHTITYTSADGKTTITQALPAASLTAGSTFIQ